MPEDSLRFKPSDEFFANNENIRQDDFDLIVEAFDPFAEVYRELGTTGADTDDVPNQKTAGFDDASGSDMHYTEGMQFDFL